MHRQAKKFSRVHASIGIFIILIIIVSLLKSQEKKLQNVTAAENTHSSEAENTQIAGRVVTLTDLLASNSKYILFGTSTTPAVTTTVPSNTPTPTASTNTKFPAQVLNLTNWKITIPFDGADSGTTADEIKQPALATYTDPNYFYVSPAGNSVIFKAHAGGATTSGSGYPRSELREMKDNGVNQAAWSSSSGKHTMNIDLKINHLPVVKPHIVVGQIHDGSNDVITFRLENKKLFIEIGGVDGPVLTDNYVLGTRFTATFEVQANQTKCYYNGVLKHTLNKNYSGAFFKTGAYTQSSCQGSKQIAGESCDAYGETEIFNVQVTHQ